MSNSHRATAALSLVVALQALSCTSSSSPETHPLDAATRPDGGVVARDLGSGRCISVNSKGQILGVDVDDSTFLLSSDGKRSRLPVPSDAVSVTGTALDDTGRVAGYVTSSSARYAAVFESGAWRKVGREGASSQALTVTAGGLVAGAVYAKPGEPRGFVIANGTAAPFDWPPGGSAVYAAAGKERIAGIFETSDGDTHAFVSEGRRLKDLGTLGGKGSAALAVNDRGDVVGTAEAADGNRHAFLVAVGDAHLVDLGLPGAAVTSDARSVDSSGRVVGNTVGTDGAQRAWFFRPDGSAVELTAVDPQGAAYVGLHVAAIAEGRAVGWGVPRDPTSGSVLRCLSWSLEP
jgi:probable HAF family extracellular repeat protein